MTRLTAADFDQELLILFDAYVHGDLDRRGFLDRAQKFAVGGLTAAGLLAALSPNFAAAQVVAKDNPRIQTEVVDVAAKPCVGWDGQLSGTTSGLNVLADHS